MSEGLVWEKVVWRHGDGRYTSEIDRGGLHATLTTPHGRTLTIPTVAWYGLLDALGAARRTKARADRPGPTRHGQRWSPVETEELVASFSDGEPVAELAKRHSRSECAVEAQLAKHGVLDRPSGDAPARRDADEHGAWPDEAWPRSYPREDGTGGPRPEAVARAGNAVMPGRETAVPGSTL